MTGWDLAELPFYLASRMEIAIGAKQSGVNSWRRDVPIGDFAEPQQIEQRVVCGRAVGVSVGNGDTGWNDSNIRFAHADESEDGRREIKFGFEIESREVRVFIVHRRNLTGFNIVNGFSHPLFVDRVREMRYLFEPRSDDYFHIQGGRFARVDQRRDSYVHASVDPHRSGVLLNGERTESNPRTLVQLELVNTGLKRVPRLFFRGDSGSVHFVGLSLEFGNGVAKIPINTLSTALEFPSGVFHLPGGVNHVAHLFRGGFVIASNCEELKNHEEKNGSRDEQLRMPVSTSATELPPVCAQFSAATFWYIPSLILAGILILCGGYGLLWMMGGVGLNWRDYGAIALGVVGCLLSAIWLIHSAASMGE
jgi:hypothetical protein